MTLPDAPLAQINVRVPQQILDVSRLIGVNRTEATIRGLIRGVCDVVGAPDAPEISPDVEAATVAFLNARRGSLLAEVAEIDGLLATMQARAARRQQKQVERDLEVCRQQQQQAEIALISDAKARFDAVLHDLSDQDLAPIQVAIEDGDLGDVTATTVTRLLSRYNLTMPTGADPEQWLVDYVVARRGVA